MRTETKVILGIVITTVVVLGGGVFFMTSNQPPPPTGDVISNNGFHWHPTLTITIKGQKQEIPAGLGVGAGGMKPFHTHDDAKDGVIHVERQGIVRASETTLAGFFQIWGKPFNSTTILDKTTGPEGTVKFLVNGQENTDFENYQMKDNDKMEIRFE